MKNQFSNVLKNTFYSLALLLMLTVSVSAQKKMLPKSSLFATYPRTIICLPSELDNFFSLSEGKEINFSFNDLMRSNGTIIKKVVKYNSLEIVVVRLKEFNDALFSLSRYKNEKKIMVYSGRIINLLNDDGYELKYFDNKTYQLVKFSLANILPDCTQQ